MKVGRGRPDFFEGKPDLPSEASSIKIQNAEWWDDPTLQVGFSGAGRPVPPEEVPNTKTQPAATVQLTSYRVMPRVLDIVLAAVGLVVLAPFFLVIALVIKLSDGGRVFYKAERVGRNGRLFQLYKFRTMTPNAHSSGPGLTIRDDVRVTRVGRFVRKFKLDELPQLANVLKGEMSFVGPRPEDPRYVAGYTAEQRRVLSCRPGITSPASLYFRNEESLLKGSNWAQMYTERILPQKLAMELEYLRHRTVWSDIEIILHTIGGITK